MAETGQKHGYDLYPVKKIKGYDSEAWEGNRKIADQLKNQIEKKRKTDKKSKVIISFDCYPGVDETKILRLAKELNPKNIFFTDEAAKETAMLNKELQEYLTDDRVFGIMCHKKLDTLFDSKKRIELTEKIQSAEGTVVIIGLGSELFCRADIYIYCSLTRWEIQLRYRKGMGNWNAENEEIPVLEKYKRGFFIEWRLADQYKKERMEQFDYILDTEKPDAPKLLSGNAFRGGLRQISREPFRMEPYFDPGVWGGHWMQKNFGLDPEAENFAWSFDGVPEENAINLLYGNVKIKIPAIDLVFYAPMQLLGERVYARFGTEFPIRFDLLDTMGGGNLSLQVHPRTEYIQNTFGMNYTQDESYYFLDADPEGDPCVYLGLKKDIDKKEMEKDLEKAQKGEAEFPAEKYVNRIPVKKHDHVMIPAGTVHCSGKNTMVLEISATPYIFTFKLWDWGRVGLDGRPRPIHIKHGIKNIHWNRDTQWVNSEALHQEILVEQKDGLLVEKTGLHKMEFIDTYRYTAEKSFEIDLNDSVHMFNLVDGHAVVIESIDNSYEPIEIHYAETAVLPAAVERCRFVPVDGEIKIVMASIRQ